MAAALDLPSVGRGIVRHCRCFRAGWVEETIMRRSHAALVALATVLFTAGAAAAAEMCACCKDGAKMPCCDEMKKDVEPAKPEAPAQPQHQH
jgi:pyrimidine deaminase RibD-like protein